MFAAVWIFGIFLIEPAWLASALRGHDEDRYSDALRSGLSPNEKPPVSSAATRRASISEVADDMSESCYLPAPVVKPLTM
jgi:hypothetical protein